MKTVAKNRRARHDYDITDTVEAGIVLSGQEVKACRASQINLAGAYVSLQSGRPVLKNATISPYSHASNLAEYDPGRERQLLLKKREVERLQSALDEQGVSLVPLEVRAGKHIKVLLGLGKGMKRLDKRQRIKDRDMKRRIREGRDV